MKHLLNAAVRAVATDAETQTQQTPRVDLNAERVPLPAQWYRSERIPEFAICLDPKDPHFGWLMQEGWASNWVSLRRLTRADLLKLQEQPSLMRGHCDAVAQLFSRLPA